jgi:anti-sigma factor RsiW
MSYQDEENISCSEFEDLLTDYLDKTLDNKTNKRVAAHALRCPLCHSLLNDVKDALDVCHEISSPKHSMTHLEARILSMTMPETAMACADFEEHLTDYLDGFLPATVFHRWERHAVLCEKCTDLPGAVVRSIAACLTYKMEELPIPAGLNNKILQATLGTTEPQKVKPTLVGQMQEWIRGLSFPISVPQLAPVAMMLLIVALVFSQTAMTDGSNVYQKSFELAGQTYQQGADIVLGDKQTKQNQNPNQEPVKGTYVNNEEK